MSTRVKAGRMRFRIHIISEIVNRDSFGGEEREDIILYSTNAQIIPLSSKEQQNGVQTQAYATHRIILRYNKSYPLHSKYRIQYDNGFFDIIDIADMDNLRRKYIILVKEIVA